VPAQAVTGLPDQGRHFQFHEEAGGVERLQPTRPVAAGTAGGDPRLVGRAATRPVWSLHDHFAGAYRCLKTCAGWCDTIVTEWFEGVALHPALWWGLRAICGE
jgi:hypothetical protein